jgi:hypothetical protein
MNSLTNCRCKLRYCISIGENCHSAAILAVNKLRYNSYIFDWAISTLDCVINVINIGLDEYINTIKNKSLSIKYPHHDDDAYKIRIAQRFFDLLLKDNIEIVFVYTTSNFIQYNKIQLFISTIQNKYPNLIFNLLLLKFNGIGEQSLNLIDNNNLYTSYEYTFPYNPPWQIREEHTRNFYMFFSKIHLLSCSINPELAELEELQDY